MAEDVAWKIEPWRGAEDLQKVLRIHSDRIIESVGTVDPDEVIVEIRVELRIAWRTRDGRDGLASSAKVYKVVNLEDQPTSADAD